MQLPSIKSCLRLLPLGFGLVLTPSSSFGQQSEFILTINASTFAISRYTGSGGAVQIPAEIDGFKVTSIGASAFESCASVTRVTVPYPIASIGDAAFFGCNGMTNLVLAEGVTASGP